MNVGKWYVGGLAFAAVVAASSLARAQENRPSRQMLGEMGLGGLVVMSDEEAGLVRGLGYLGSSQSSVRVYGNSFATINGGTQLGGHSENGYDISGKNFAAGANGSAAGIVHISTGNKGNGGYGGSKPRPTGSMGGSGFGGSRGINVRATVVFAGGFSVGAAH